MADRPQQHNPNEPLLPEGFNTTPTLADLIQDDSLTFRERLVKMFKANDFVRVINIDDEPFEWQETPISHEFVHQPDKVTYDVYRKTPNRYVLRPAEMRILDGGNAYLMVEGLFKKIILKKTAGKGTGMGSPQTQGEYIEKIVLGVEDLNSLTSLPQPSPTPAESLKSNDLGEDLNEFPAIKHRGRPAKTA